MTDKPPKRGGFPSVRAKVILARCPASDSGRGLFGIRIEERSRIWYRTWAFRISEGQAKREGWSSERFTTSLNALPGYNGCPYCGGFSLAQCACGNLFCAHTNVPKTGAPEAVELKCPWCGQTSVFTIAEALHVQGDGF